MLWYKALECGALCCNCKSNLQEPVRFDCANNLCRPAPDTSIDETKNCGVLISNRKHYHMDMQTLWPNGLEKQISDATNFIDRLLSSRR